MYENNIKTFEFYKKINEKVLYKYNILPLLKQKIKKLINHLSLGYIIPKENGFKETNNLTHAYLCELVKKHFQTKDVLFKENMLFSFKVVKKKGKRKSFDIVEPDFLVIYDNYIDVIEVKSKYKKENLQKGMSQLLLTDFIINSFLLSHFLKTCRDLYLVTKWDIYYLPYLVMEDVKYNFYKEIRKDLSSLYKKTAKKQKEIVEFLVSTSDYIIKKL